MVLKRSRGLGTDEYAEDIAKALDKVFAPKKGFFRKGPNPARNARATVAPEQLKIVVFSDLHRGTWKDRSDDFRRSHRAYRAALGWYLERGYALYLLGDIEELWENSPEDVVETYAAVLGLEREFTAAPGGGLRRFYGNHDMDWNNAKNVKKHLADWLGNVPVLESLQLEVREGDDALGLFFFVHGHHGTPGSDTFSFVSRFAVRVGWRAIQRSQGWLATTPAESPEIRDKHDLAMYKWAKRRAGSDPKGARPILVAGHTHHPVFPGKPPERPTEERVQALRDELRAEHDPQVRATKRATLELMASEVWEKPYEVPLIDPPCYFNTGCSSFPDGDVTCLEISGEQLHDAALEDKADGRGKIRLIRWLDDGGKPEPHEVACRSLREVLGSVNA